MAKNWVINASPLIVLARINYENLLFELSDKLVIPQAVVSEIKAGPSDDSARLFLEKSDLQIVKHSYHEEITAWDLGAGETAVLAYAHANPNWVAILDDGAARKCARSFSVPCKGTLGVILLAKKKGLISSAADILHILRENGFRLDNRLLRDVLPKTVGEIWE